MRKITEGELEKILELHYLWVKSNGIDGTQANLSRANLCGADIRWTDLCGTDLSGANLCNTVLDRKNKPNGEIPESAKRTKLFVYGYRYKTSTLVGNTTFQVGKTYTSPVFSTCSTECHPGLYLFFSIKELKEWGNAFPIPDRRIIQVKTRIANVHKAGRKYRTKRFKVTKDIKAASPAKNTAA